MFRKFNLNNNWLILIPALSSLLVLLIIINKPFIGHHDFTAVFNGMIAKNYYLFGPLELKFGQVTSIIAGNPSEVKSFYTHYPPLLPFLIFLSFKLFGVVEWAERLVPLIFSVLGVSFFYLLVKKITDIKTALIASFFYVFNPMFIYFGNMPVADPVTVSLGVMIVYFYIEWLTTQREKFFYLFNFFILIGGLISWSIGYIPVLIILHSLILKKFQKKLLLSLLIFILSLLLLLWHDFVLTGDFFGGGLLSTLVDRSASNALSFGGLDFSLGSYIKQQISWLQAFYTRILLILSLIFVLTSIKSKFDLRKTTLFIFLLFGLGHLIIFSRYVFIHDFLNIYLLPFLAFSGALGVDWLIKKVERFNRNIFLSQLLVVIILITFSFERIQFTETLLNISVNHDGRDMAEILNNLQNGHNQAVILSPRFEQFYGVFATFYSQYAFGIAEFNDLKKVNYFNNYRYIITIDEDIIDQQLYEQLISKYRSEKIGDKTIFYVKQ